MTKQEIEKKIRESVNIANGKPENELTKELLNAVLIDLAKDHHFEVIEILDENPDLMDIFLKNAGFTIKDIDDATEKLEKSINSKMIKFYGSFGQIHRHEINDIIFDKDCLVEIEAESEDEARIKMFELFKDKWHRLYTPDDYVDVIEFFPRGVVKLPIL